MNLEALDLYGCARLVKACVSHVVTGTIRYKKWHRWKLDGYQLLGALHFVNHSPLLGDFCEVYGYDGERIRAKVNEQYLPFLESGTIILPPPGRVECWRCLRDYYRLSYRETKSLRKKLCTSAT